jgi:hypothetical protein
MVAKTDYQRVLEIVSSWPYDDRARLIDDLTQGLVDQLPPPPRDTLSRAIGLLKTDAPPPSDEEVKQWIHEHRMNKYGQR